MSVYVDASALVPLFLPDVFNARIEAYLLTGPADILVSDLSSAEFASVVGIRLRSGLLPPAKAREAFLNLDVWIDQNAETVEARTSDIRDAEAMLRRLDLVLRAPDAIHLAIAQRLGAELATFDQRMADCARAIGLSVAAL